MFPFLNNEFDNQGSAQISRAPCDPVPKIAEQGAQLDALRAAARNVVANGERGELVAAVRELAQAAQ